MIKALSICFAVLFAQLVALQWVDKRVNTAPMDARSVTTVVTAAHRDKDDDATPSSEIDEDVAGSA